MFARLVATRPAVSLASTAAATSTSTTTHVAQQHARAFSFFSSKSGGAGDGNGNKYKYFTANSSSSRRSSPPSGANGNGGNGGAASSKPKMDGSTTTAATAVGTTTPADTTTTTTTPKSQPHEDTAKKGDSSPSVTSPSQTSITSGWTASSQPQPVHTAVSQKDLYLHSFFSGHRPLLLLSQPSSSVFESWPDLQLSNNPDPAVSQHRSLLDQLGGINLEDPPEATPETDADAARLLNRALVVNRLGGTVSWEETLARLGVAEDRMSLTEMGMGAHDVMDVDASMGGFDAYMDSTKRKKRRKMKKHKLKKRRRLQRSQRIKIGR